MVIKKYVFTVMGIVLSFIIAVGGWVVTSRLIDMESDRLLSGTTSFMVDIPTIEVTHVDEESGYPTIRLSLTEDEMVSILQNLELTDNRRMHEPAPGQIDMEQAIAAGRAGLAFLHGHNILPDEMLGFNYVRAMLSQNVSQDGQFFPLTYSFWQVTFLNDDIDIGMTINAVTGQVWGIEILTRQPAYMISPVFERMLHINIDEVEYLLSAFLLNLDVVSDADNVQIVYSKLPTLPSSMEMFLDEYVFGVYFENVMVARQSFAGEGGSAIITASSGAISNRALYFTGLNIGLSGMPLHPWVYIP